MARLGSEFDSSDDDERQQRQRLPDRLQQDDADEVLARPVVGELGAPEIGGGKAGKSETTTSRASKCRSSQIEIGTSTNIGSAP